MRRAVRVVAALAATSAFAVAGAHAAPAGSTRAPTPTGTAGTTTPVPTPPTTTSVGPGGVRIQQGITYQIDNGPPGQAPTPELLDAYLPPEGPGVTPAVVLVHGGGWAGGSRSVLAPEAQELAEQQGWASFTIDYVLEGDPTQVPWEDEVDDVQAAVRFVAAHAQQFGIDPKRIGMIGASAGGELVAMVAVKGTLDDGSPHDQNDVPGAKPVNPVVVATWSGVFDLGQLASIAGSPPTGCAGDPACIGVFLPNAIPTYVGCPEASCEQQYDEASPLTYVSRQTAPMFIANSQEELIPLEQPDEMIAALRKYGVPNQLQILPGELHAQEYAAQIMPDTIDFMDDYLDVAAPVPRTTAAPTEAAAAGDDNGDDNLPWIVAAGAGAVIALGLLVLVLARGRRVRPR